MPLASLTLTVLLAATVDPSPPSPSPPAARPLVLVSAAAPLDGQRLADALAAYLDERGVKVELVAPVEAPELEARIAGLRETAARAGALAAVHVQRSPVSVQIDLVDVVTDKSLLAIIATPGRDADLYRTVALKIQALLRATASEPESPAATSPPMARLAVESRPPPEAAPPVLSLGAGYALWTFAPDGLTAQGLAVEARARVASQLAVALGAAALTAVRGKSGDAAVSASVYPLDAAVLARLVDRRLQLWAGLAAQVALVDATASGTGTATRRAREPFAAVGARAEAKLAVGSATWLSLSAALSAVALGERFTLAGAPAVDMSSLLAVFGLGIGVALR